MASQRVKGITIEIGGDSTRLTKALASVDKALKTTQTNLRDIDKALKMDPTNVNLLKDRQRELAVEVENTKKKLETEKQALEQMKQTDGFDANSEAARNLQTQIDLDTVALKELEAQAREAGSIIGSQMQAAGQKITELGNKIREAGNKMAAVGQSLTTKVTMPIVGAFGAAVKTTMDFDSQMSKVKAISGATGQEFQQLRDKAREMGEDTKFSATEAGQAFEYMGMAGWKTEQMMAGIPAILNLAAAAGEELGTTSDIVTDALTAFGLKAEDASRFADVLAAASTNSNTNVSMLGESFKYAAAPAGALGYSIEDVAVALGLMANSGIKADMAGTSLRNMFQRMAKPTKESAMAMERLGLELYDEQGQMYTLRQVMDHLRQGFTNINMSVEDYDAALDQLDADLEAGNLTQSKYEKALEELNLQAFGAEGAEKARAAAMLGGARAMSGLLAIANTSESEYQKLTEAIDSSSQSFARLADGSVVPLNEALASGAEVLETYEGQAAAMAATMQDNLGGDLTILKSKLSELAISFGDLLMPTIRKAVDGVQKFVDKLNALDDSQKEQIIKIAAIVAAIGPALLIIGKIVSGVGSVIAVGGKVLTLVGQAVTHFGGLSGVLAALTSPIGLIIAAVAALGAAFAYLFVTNEDFRNSVMEVAGVLKDNLANAMNTIKPIVEELKESFKAMMIVLEPAFEFLFKFLAGIASGIINAVGPVLTVVKSIVDFITNIVQAFVALLTGDIDGFFEHIGQALQAWLNGMLAFIQAHIALVTGFFSAFGVDLVQTFTNIWVGVKTAISVALEAIKGAIMNVWNSIKTWISTTITAIKTNFEEIFTQIYTAVSEKVTDVKNAITEGIGAAVEYVSSLPEKFYNWGVDMISNLVSGIKEKIKDVKETIKGVASTIASYIHFTEPDVGPLSNFHTFMPDMIDLLTKGITDGLPQVANAMSNLASTMVPSIDAPQLGAGTTTNTFNINVYGAQGQDVSELADILEQRIASNVMRRGVVFG